MWGCTLLLTSDFFATKSPQAYRQLHNIGRTIAVMDTLNPHIVYVERLNGSVAIGFDDGKTALYSAALLYEILPRAKDLTGLLADDDAAAS
jgi:DUF971 family protein